MTHHVKLILKWTLVFSSFSPRANGTYLLKCLRQWGMSHEQLSAVTHSIIVSSLGRTFCCL